MLMIRNIDLCVQIPGLSRTSTKIPGLSRPGIQILKFQDFPGFQGPVRTPYFLYTLYGYVLNEFENGNKNTPAAAASKSTTTTTTTIS